MRLLSNENQVYFYRPMALLVSTSDLVKEIATNFAQKKHIINIPMWSQKILKGIKPNIHLRLFGNLVVDNSKTIETLGYKPKYSFSDGIRQMVEWYLQSKKRQ